MRWYELAPEAALAAGLGVFAATEPRAASAGLRSAKSLALIATIGGLWLVARAASFLFVRQRFIRLAPFAVGALVILRAVVLPAYHDHTVIETLAREPSASAAPAAPAPAPVAVRTGRLTGIDHRADGTVTLYRRSTGAVVVALEDFDIQPGPAYAVYVVPGLERRDHDGGTRLAALRGNRGTQFYDAPIDVDLSSAAWTVLVWCETFDVPVAHATPA